MTTAAAVALAVVGVTFAVLMATLALVRGTPLSALAFAAGMAGFALTGSVVAAKRPDNPVGWLLAGYGVTAIAGQGSADYASAAQVLGWPALAPTAWVGSWLWAAGLPLLALALLRFPDGSRISPRWRWAEALAGAGLVLVGTVAALAWIDRGPALVGLADPSHYPGPAGSVWRAGTWAVFGPVFAGVGALAIRYRSSDVVVRLQIRWVLLPSALLFLGVLGFVLTGAPGVDAHPLAEAFAAAGFIGIPLALGNAVLRYRLYDIDRLLSRTVSYAILSTLLLAVYAASVVVLGRLAAPLAPASDLAVAGSTLVAFGVFHPARRRVQAVVDRRFDRARYDAQRIVEDFRARLRDEIHLDEVTDHLLSAVGETVQPVGATVWLRAEGARR